MHSFESLTCLVTFSIYRNTKRDISRSISMVHTLNNQRNVLISSCISLFFTAIYCEAPAVYRLSTSACPATCVDPNAGRRCSEKPVEGCECPEGTVLDDNNKCVPPEECGCRYKGYRYDVSRDLNIHSSMISKSI